MFIKTCELVILWVLKSEPYSLLKAFFWGGYFIKQIQILLFLLYNWFSMLLICILKLIIWLFYYILDDLAAKANIIIDSAEIKATSMEDLDEDEETGAAQVH